MSIVNRFKPGLLRAVRLRYQQGVAEQAIRETMGSDRLVDIIKRDHTELRTCYDKYKKAASSDEANQWFNQFVWELCRHSVAEELVVYPMLEKVSDRGRQLADKSRADHHKVKEMLSETLNVKDNMSEFDNNVEKLWTDLEKHLKMEESEDLPILADAYQSESQNAWATTKFAAMKKTAPTQPHTLVPEKPVALEGALGMLMAPLDKFKDLFKDFPSMQEGR